MRRRRMPTFTMRLPDDEYEALQAMSLLTGRSMADLVRDAVSESLTYFASSSELDQSFKDELRARELAVERLRQRLSADQRETADDSSDVETEASKRADRQERTGAPARG
jgi:Ribbon-helix-helix protein, copG family